MASVDGNQLIAVNHRGPDSPDDPGLVSVDELMAYAVPSTVASTATSQVVSRAASGALDSVPVSTADSKAVSAATRASVADSKAVSTSTNTSVADSKAISVSSNTSIADSKAVSLDTALIIPAVNNLPGFIQPLTGAVIRTANRKMADIITPQDFGAVADWNGTTGTDNHAAFTAMLAALPHDSGTNRASRGGRIVIPNGRYYLSQTLVIEKQVTIEGGGLGFWEYAAGTQLVFPANTTGIRIYAATDSPSGTSGAGTKISGVFLYCKDRQTTGHGFHITAQAELDHFAVANFAEYNVYTVADASLSQGQASKSIFRNGQIDDAGKHNFYLSGDDANVCLVEAVQCSNAGSAFWNFYDDSGIGNTYVNTLTQGTGGSYKATRSTASHLYLNAYTEGGLAELVRPSIVVGGTLANTNRLTAASTCLVIDGDGLIRRAMNFIGSATRSTAGDTPTSIYLGDDADPPGQTGTVLAYSADEEGVGSHRLKYDATNKWWSFEYANSSSARSIRLPGGLASKPFYGPLFENGFYQGATNNLVSRTLDTAAPTSGTWTRGSIVYNSAPSASGTIGWVCVTAGTPGTWKTFGAISA